MVNNIPRWNDNTREERYFTAVLFQALISNETPFWRLVRPRLQIPETVTVVDVGYEVCLLRDLAHACHIVRERRVRALEKQTVDFVITLSDSSLVLIEAKAHQRFSIRQINNMFLTREILLANTSVGISDVHIAGLHSSKYDPINVRAQFPSFALSTWKELANIYPGMRCRFQGLGGTEAQHPFLRANEIYNN